MSCEDVNLSLKLLSRCLWARHFNFVILFCKLHVITNSSGIAGHVLEVGLNTSHFVCLDCDVENTELCIVSFNGPELNIYG